ncbi:MAG TPA: gamma-glutamylcyclotransferase [Longimicrobiales bacterium]
MAEHVHVFVYDTARFPDVESELVRHDVVGGTLFDVEGVGPALMLSGQTRVPGTVRRIRPETLPSFDRSARVDDGLFRRVGVRVGNTPCWTWVAGAELAQRLASARTRATGST